MLVLLQVGPEDVQGATRESGRSGRSLFCFGELERATAILEHFVDLARDGYDSRSESCAPPIMASSACILISCPFFLASF
jgi:hypothetical protein